MAFGGYKNREVVVNLSSGEVGYRTIDPGLARKFIGGRGLDHDLEGFVLVHGCVVGDT